MPQGSATYPDALAPGTARRGLAVVTDVCRAALGAFPFDNSGRGPTRPPRPLPSRKAEGLATRIIHNDKRLFVEIKEARGLSPARSSSRVKPPAREVAYIALSLVERHGPLGWPTGLSGVTPLVDARHQVVVGRTREGA